MSTINTQTRILRPTDETRAEIAEGRIPQWQAPLNTRRTHEGRHRANEDLTTRQIPVVSEVLREPVMEVPVVSAPVHVPEPVTVPSSPSKLSMLWSNLRGRR